MLCLALWGSYCKWMEDMHVLYLQDGVWWNVQTVFASMLGLQSLAECFTLFVFVLTWRIVCLTGLAIQLRVWVGQALGALRTGSGSLTHRQVCSVVKQCRVDWEWAAPKQYAIHGVFDLFQVLDTSLPHTGTETITFQRQISTPRILSVETKSTCDWLVLVHELRPKDVWFVSRRQKWWCLLVTNTHNPLGLKVALLLSSS